MLKHIAGFAACTLIFFVFYAGFDWALQAPAPTPCTVNTQYTSAGTEGNYSGASVTVYTGHCVIAGEGD